MKAAGRPPKKKLLPESCFDPFFRATDKSEKMPHFGAQNKSAIPSFEPKIVVVPYSKLLTAALRSLQQQQQL